MGPVFTDYLRHANDLIQAALQAAEPGTAVRRFLRRDGCQLRLGDLSYDLDQGNVFFCKCGQSGCAYGDGGC